MLVAASSSREMKPMPLCTEQHPTMQSYRKPAGSRGSSWPCTLIASSKRLVCCLGQLCSMFPQISRQCFCATIGCLSAWGCMHTRRQDPDSCGSNCPVCLFAHFRCEMK